MTDQKDRIDCCGAHTIEEKYQRSRNSVVVLHVAIGHSINERGTHYYFKKANFNYEQYVTTQVLLCREDFCISESIAIHPSQKLFAKSRNRYNKI